MSATTTVTITTDDAAEITYTLEWLRDWFAHDPETLGGSLRRFSFGLFTLDDLASELAGFATILGGRP